MTVCTTAAFVSLQPAFKPHNIYFPCKASAIAKQNSDFLSNYARFKNQVSLVGLRRPAFSCPIL